MPHAVRESHIDDICANCKKIHGKKDVVLIFQHHRVYELITCQGCGYKLLRLKDEVLFNNKYDFM